MALNPISPLYPRTVLSDGTVLPFGFKFKPTDEQMVEAFLINKVLGRPLPVNSIKDGIDVYLHDPDDLPIDIKGRDAIWAYFFVFRPEDGGGGADSVRRTPGGYWKVSDTAETFLDGGDEPAALLNELVFYKGNPPDGIETEWKMDEHRLNPELEEYKNPNDPKMENCVACRIYKEAPSPFVFQVEEDEEVESEESEEDEEITEQKILQL